MLIDTSAYVGHWPFRKLYGNTPDGLDAIAQKADITHMFVASLQALMYKDVMQGNLELYEELKSYSGKTELIPFAMVNPSYPAWQEDMTRCVKELGFRGIELAPSYHGYQLAKEGVEAFKLAEELGVPVRICGEFENWRQHHRLDVGPVKLDTDIAAMLAAGGNATLFLNGFHASTFCPELVEQIKARKNVFFDFTRSGCYHDFSFDNTVKIFGFEHFCFGTLSPFYYAETNLVRLHFGARTPENEAKIAYQNVQPYLK